MNREVSISVIIATYKRYEKLCNCLNSLLRNKLNGFDKFEVIVVDDGGHLKRKIETEINGLDIKWIYNKENKGQPAAQATGVKQAKGKLLAFLDDDAEVDNNWLKSIYDYFLQNDDIDVVLGRIEPIDITHVLPRMRQKIYDRRDKKYCDPNFVKKMKEKYKLNVRSCTNLSDHISGGNFACRRELLEFIGGFREHIRRNNDTDMSTRILESGNAIGYNPQMIILHHHSKSYKVLFRTSFIEGRNYIRMVQNTKTTKIKLFFEVIINLLLAPFRIISFPEMLEADKFFIKPYLIYTGIKILDALGRVHEFNLIVFHAQK